MHNSVRAIYFLMTTGKLPRFFGFSEDLFKDNVNYYNDPLGIAKWLLGCLGNEP